MRDEPLIEQRSKRGTHARVQRSARLAGLTARHLHGIIHAPMDASRVTQPMLWTTSQQVGSVLQAMAEARQAEAVRIGRLIAGLRDRKGWSQEDLAHEVDVSTSTISRWERGLHKGYGPNVRRLATALEVEPGALLPADDLLVGSQLDRLEARVDEISGQISELRDAFLGGQGVAEVVDDVVDQVEASGGSHPSKTPGRPKSRRATRKRKPA